MFTRKHYKAIAKIVFLRLPLGNIPDMPLVTDKTIYAENKIFLQRLADYFAEDNPLFDRQKFLEACGI